VRAMFHKLLLPVDLSPRAELALDAVRQIAVHGAEVELVHVVERIPGLDEAEIDDFYTELEARARKQLEAWAEPLRQEGFRVTLTLSVGKRGSEVLRRVRESGCDLVVLASHPLDPDEPSRALGTVSHQVALVAPCPVLLLR